jgi:hypothetical protein
MRRTFVLKRDEIIGGWRKLNSEELLNLYSLPSIIRVIKSRRIRWAAHLAKQTTLNFNLTKIFKLIVQNHTCI